MLDGQPYEKALDIQARFNNAVQNP